MVWGGLICAFLPRYSSSPHFRLYVCVVITFEDQEPSRKQEEQIPTILHKVSKRMDKLRIDLELILSSCVGFPNSAETAGKSVLLFDRL